MMEFKNIILVSIICFSFIRCNVFKEEKNVTYQWVNVSYDFENAPLFIKNNNDSISFYSLNGETEFNGIIVKNEVFVKDTENNGLLIRVASFIQSEDTMIVSFDNAFDKEYKFIKYGLGVLQNKVMNSKGKLNKSLISKRFLSSDDSIYFDFYENGVVTIFNKDSSLLNYYNSFRWNFLIINNLSLLFLENNNDKGLIIIQYIDDKQASFDFIMMGKKQSFNCTKVNTFEKIYNVDISKKIQGDWNSSDYTFLEGIFFDEGLYTLFYKSDTLGIEAGSYFITRNSEFIVM